jgi:hypothetical protein
MTKKRWIYLTALSLIIALTLRASPPIGAAATGSPQKLDSRIKAPSKYSAQLPTGEFQDNQIELAPDQDRRVLRESRYKGTYDEVKDPADTDPTGPTEDAVVLINDYAEKVDPFPASRSAAVVIGTVLSGKAHVSKDRTYVYSDYQIRIDKVLKQDPASNLAVGGQLVASRGGGTIHFPSGHIRHYVNHGEGSPAMGSQYLFFLVKPDIPEPEYEVIIGGAYELRNGKVHPLDDLGMALDNISEAEFLGKVEAAIGGIDYAVAIPTIRTLVVNS